MQQHLLGSAAPGWNPGRQRRAGNISWALRLADRRKAGSVADGVKPLNLRFAAVMLLYGAVMFVVYRDELLGRLLAPLAVVTAWMTAISLSRMGIDVLRDGAFLSHPEGFAYEVAYTCTGFVPALTFAVCVLASSASARAKCAGIAVGVPVLVTVNLVRLAHLFYLGVYFHGAFRFAHEVMWEIFLAVAVVGLWVGWLRRIRPAPSSCGPAAGTAETRRD